MHPNIERIADTTPDFTAERAAMLRELFPEAWGEDGLDFDALRQALGDLSDERSERYLFSWAGKREALQLLQTPSRATLHPAPGDSLDWDATHNLFVEGDNLEALKLLYKPLFNRVKMIYIDPPYNTGNDFIYPDNFADPLHNYLVQTGQKDANGDLQSSDVEKTGRVHSRWLSMMYPRLFLARQLLRDDGVIFVSIDDNEVHHLRLLMNEIFGAENFVANISVVNNLKGRSDERYIATAHEQLLMFRKSDSFDTYGLPTPEEYQSEYKLRDADGQPYRLQGLRKRGANSLRKDRPNMFYPFFYDEAEDRLSLSRSKDSEAEIWPKLSDGVDGRWRWGKETSSERSTELVVRTVAGREEFDVFQKDYLYENGELKNVKSKSVWLNSLFSTDAGTRAYKQLMNDAPFQNPKSPHFIVEMLRQATKANDIILDFFAGSGTTAQAVLELNREDGGNRRFVLVQLPEPTGNAAFPTIADIAKERVRRVAGRMEEAGNGKLDLETRESPEDLGFKVWKLGESNFRQMQPTPQGDTSAYLEQLELMNDRLLPGFDPHSALYEVALREGFGLNAHLEAHPEVAGMWRVSDSEKEQWFWASLEPSLDLDALRPLGLQADDLFVCRGVALDDTTAANLALQCRLKMI